jgi:hypothetical protein
MRSKLRAKGGGSALVGCGVRLAHGWRVRRRGRKGVGGRETSSRCAIGGPPHNLWGLRGRPMTSAGQSRPIRADGKEAGRGSEGQREGGPAPPRAQGTMNLAQPKAATDDPSLRSTIRLCARQQRWTAREPVPHACRRETRCTRRGVEEKAVEGKQNLIAPSGASLAPTSAPSHPGPLTPHAPTQRAHRDLSLKRFPARNGHKGARNRKNAWYWECAPPLAHPSAGPHAPAALPRSRARASCDHCAASRPPTG